MKKIIFTGLICYIALMLYQIPAAYALKLLQKASPVPTNLNINNVSGSVWKGQLDTSITNFPFSLAWSIDPLPLFTGRFGLILSIKADQFQFSSNIAINNNYKKLSNLNAEIDPEIIQQFASHVELESPAPLIANGITIAYNNGQFTKASGHLEWKGGNITLPNASKNHRIPATQATPRINENKELIVDVLATESNIKIAEAGITKDNEGYVKVFAAISKYIPLPKNYQNVSEDTAIFESYQPLGHYLNPRADITSQFSLPNPTL